MNRTAKAVTFGAATLAAVVAGAGIALATGGDDDDSKENGKDVPITGNALDRAARVALAHTGQGTVVDTEVDRDSESYYEVEVELRDGSVAEVELSRGFKVVGGENEGAENEGVEGPDDD